MRLLSVDIETTGLDPTQDQILEVGMIYQDNLGGRRTFHTFVSHTRYCGNAFALAMNAAILKEIANLEKGKVFDDLCTLEELPGKLDGWFTFLSGNEGDFKKFVLCGKNVSSFDMAFLKMVPGWDFAAKWFGHRALDIGPMYTLPTDEVPPDLKECLKRAGLHPQVDHRAISDATAVLDCINAKWSVL